MPQFYEVTVLLSFIIGWLLNDLYHNFSMATLQWIVILFIIVVVNEKTGAFESISKWIRRSLK